MTTNTVLASLAESRLNTHTPQTWEDSITIQQANELLIQTAQQERDRFIDLGFEELEKAKMNERARIVALVEDKIKEVEGSFMGDGFVTQDMKSFAIIALKDVRTDLLTRMRGNK